MKKNNVISKTLLPLALAVVCLAPLDSFGQKWKEKLKAAKEQMNGGTAEKEEEKVEVKVLNEYHQANEGKVVFYNKSIEYGSSSASDSPTNVITDRVIGGDGTFGFRAYIGKLYKGACEGCDGMDIRYTLGGVSVTTQQIRQEFDQNYFRMASIYSFYDSKNYSVGVSLTADAGKYYDMYTLQEDTYRILLSKVKDQLTVGASLTLKVEIISIKGDVPTENILASGEIVLKVTEESNNLRSLNCRCGKAGMTDEKIVKDVTEAFEFQFDDVKEVNKIVLLGRDFEQNYDDSYPTKLVTSKGMWVNIVYENTSGVHWMVKRYIFYKKIGDTFSEKATIGKHKFFLPISPTCAFK